MLTQDQAFDDRYVWSLLADELSLLLRLNDTGRLRFAIQLKFRQVQGLYPESINEFPSRTVHAQVLSMLLLSRSDALPYSLKLPLSEKACSATPKNIRHYFDTIAPHKTDISKFAV